MPPSVTGVVISKPIQKRFFYPLEKSSGLLLFVNKLRYIVTKMFPHMPPALKYLCVIQLLLTQYFEGYSQLSTEGGYPEVPMDSCDFDNDSCSILQPIDLGSVWMIGVPSKEVLDEAHSPFKALITGDSFPYPPNKNDYVQFEFPNEDVSEKGICYFKFWHQYQFDSTFDGGLIKFSFDSLPYLTINDWNTFPGWDSLFSSIDCEGNCDFLYTPVADGFGVTGNSSGWEFTSIRIMYTLPVRLGRISDYFAERTDLRFYLLSDSVDGFEDGWAIDDILITVQEAGGDVKDFNFFELKLYPNPAGNSISIYSEIISTSFFNLSIYDMNGSAELFYDHAYSEDGNYLLNINALPAGIYFIVIENEKGTVIGKVVKV